MRIENAFGSIDFGLKNDLNDEEDESYLPECYAGSVIELQMIKGKAPGDGTRLMEAFLDDPAVKEAKLIFLDCSPHYDDQRPEAEALQRLHDFYAKFGFVAKQANGYARMWRIQALPDDLEACFREGYDPLNDFHPVLNDAIRAFHTKEKDAEMTKKMTQAEMYASSIFIEGLKAAKQAVEDAANEANVSPEGFEIDGTFCDFGEIDTSGVADAIMTAAEQFGPFGSFNYSYAQDLLCIEVKKAFAAPKQDLDKATRDKILADPIYRQGLDNAITQVERAAASVGASPTGFQIDNTFCDHGAIKTDHVMETIQHTATRFGETGTHDNVMAEKLLCQAVTDYFETPAPAAVPHKVYTLVFIDREEGYGTKEALQGPFVFDTREEAVNKAWDYIKVALAYGHTNELVEYAFNQGFPIEFDPNTTSLEELSQSLDDLVPADKREALTTWGFAQRDADSLEAFFEIDEVEVNLVPPAPAASKESNIAPSF